MANLKIFVSSTCYDLNVVRSQLRGFILGLGYEPVMSDFSDVLYDPRAHTHTSCIQEVTNCDMLILVIGSRFGGTAIPKAIEEVDLLEVMNKSKGRKVFENVDKLSITQLEVVKAIEYNIPIFTFIDSKVFHDHLVYESNKDKGMADKITYPSVDKQVTASYIFEFINFLRLRVENNNITEYTRMEEIETFLRKQWSGLLQRLLYEQRSKKTEERKMDFLAQQIADLKTAIMTSITSTDLKETAMGAIKFRRLIDLIHSIGNENARSILMSMGNWDDLLISLKIKQILPSQEGRYMSYLVLDDETYYKVRIPMKALIIDFRNSWNEFTQLSPEAKEAVITAIIGLSAMGNGPSIARFYNEKFSDAETSSIKGIDIDESQDIAPVELSHFFLKQETKKD